MVAREGARLLHLCRLDLADRVPDHSTFSKNRRGRFRESDLLRQVFEATVKACIAAGLVGGERFAVDASLIEADANKRRAVTSADWNADAIDPKEAPQAVREYLAVLDDAAFGAASDAPPKRVAPSDPAAQWTGAGGGHATFAYAANYLIDTDNGVIVDAAATRAIRQAETCAARAMIDRTMDRFGLYPVWGPLAALVAATPESRRRGPIVTTLEGKRWTGDGVRTEFSKAREFVVAKAKALQTNAADEEAKRFADEMVAIADRRFADLRGTAATMLRRAGCTIEEISAITGHKRADVSRILDKHYLKNDGTLAPRRRPEAPKRSPK